MRKCSICGLEHNRNRWMDSSTCSQACFHTEHALDFIKTYEENPTSVYIYFVGDRCIGWTLSEPLKEIHSMTEFDKHSLDHLIMVPGQDDRVYIGKPHRHVFECAKDIAFMLAPFPYLITKEKAEEILT